MKETEIIHNRPACAYICAASGMNGTVARTSLNDLRVESRSTNFLAPNSKHMLRRSAQEGFKRELGLLWLLRVLCTITMIRPSEARPFTVTSQSFHQNERDGSGATSEMPHQSFTRVSVCSLCITFITANLLMTFLGF